MLRLICDNSVGSYLVNNSNVIKCYITKVFLSYKPLGFCVFACCFAIMNVYYSVYYEHGVCL